MSPQTILIEQEDLRIEIVPDIGAGIARFEAKVLEKWIALMRGTEVHSSTKALGLGSVLMIPWTNRIFGGGFNYGDRIVKLEPNLPHIPLPIHGNALTEKWQVINTDANSVKLSLRSKGPSDFDYYAEVSYKLEKNALAIDLYLRHEGKYPMPYGLGIHPWFTRTKNTSIKAPATSVCIVDEQSKPIGFQSVKDLPHWNFNQENQMPNDPIDNCFCGWNGEATIFWHDLKQKLDITASKNLASYFQLFSPKKDCDFVCFEPVSHFIDEHNYAGVLPNKGLIELDKGEHIDANVKLVLKPL